MDRSKSIGATDAVRICGLSEYGNAHDVWMEKTGRSAGFNGNSATIRGQYFEGGVANWFIDNCEGCSKYNADTACQLRHIEHSFISGSPDRLLYNELGDVCAILEIKTTKSKTEEPLKSWIAQLNWYLGLTGFKAGYIAWFCMFTDEFYYKKIDFDKELYDTMLEGCVRFWNEYVLTDKEPPIVEKTKTLELEDGDIEIDFDLYNAICEYNEANTQIKELEEKKKQAKDVIGSLSSYKNLYFGDKKVAGFIYNKGRESVDLTKLKQNLPNNWEDYIKTSAGYYTFRVYE